MWRAKTRFLPRGVTLSVGEVIGYIFFDDHFIVSGQLGNESQVRV